MSFPILFGGWFLVAWAVSWPIHIGAEVACHKFIHQPVGQSINFSWYGDALPRVLWSFVFALGATLISTADLGWSP